MNKELKLSLLVIRSAIPDQLADFYKLLGLDFEYHRHGNGVFHYAGYIGPTLLEIYPLSRTQVRADLSLRIGITLNDFEARISLLQDQGVFFQQLPSSTEWGLMAIVEDPEGRKLELYKV